VTLDEERYLRIRAASRQDPNRSLSRYDPGVVAGAAAEIDAIYAEFPDIVTPDGDVLDPLGRPETLVDGNRRNYFLRDDVELDQLLTRGERYIELTDRIDALLDERQAEKDAKTS
jgi:hypothetical protein